MGRAGSHSPAHFMCPLGKHGRCLPGVRRFRYMTVSVHTLSVRFFGTASFGTLNVNIGTVTFSTYKISVQSTSVHKCQFRYKHLRYKSTMVFRYIETILYAVPVLHLKKLIF